ncbi:hypothetical protein PSTT_03087, partial [Puccinia striiformis]
RNQTMTLYNEKGNRNENRTKKVRNERASDRQDGTQDDRFSHGIPDQIRHHSMSLSSSLTMLASALSLFMSVKSSSLLAYSKVNPLISSQFEFDETKNLNEKYNQKKD